MINMSVDSNEVHIREQTSEVVMDPASGTNNYEKLRNLPTLNGKLILGDVVEEDPTVPQWAKQESKPGYTPEEIRAIGQDDEMSLEDIMQMMDSVFN